MAYHNVLAEANLHENKGVSTAANNTVASATSNATVWRKVNADMIDTTSIFNTNETIVTVSLVDVSTAETAYIVFPFAVTITKVSTVLHGVISGADATLTVRNHSGGSMGTITVAQSGSAAGDLDSLSPVSNNTIAANEKMSIETDGASTGAQKLSITVFATVTG